MSEAELPGSAAGDFVDPKELAALHRGIPATRMLDYGMTGQDATFMAALDGNGPAWDVAAAKLAGTHVAQAGELIAKGLPTQAAQELEWAAAALNIGQLAFNIDVPRKVDLYRRASALLDQATSLWAADFRRLTLTDVDGTELFGWELPNHAASGCVVIIGGLSGWGASYLDMARAFARRGMAVLLAEVSGQGETRMSSGLYLSHASLARIGLFIEYASRSAPAVGVMGNSFGGLIAAHVAAANERVRACCINGGPPQLVVPEFRTAREQLAAAFGAEGEALDALVAEFCFDPLRTPIRCPTLILEGGADPLVAVGSQAGFLSGPNREGSVIRTWPDGEHTLYNHAAERNAFASAWFADHFEKDRG